MKLSALLFSPFSSTRLDDKVVKFILWKSLCEYVSSKMWNVIDNCFCGSAI